MSFLSEIREQPQVVERLLASQHETARRIAAEIERRDLRSIYIAARGSSDNAALYGKYLWGSLARLPVALATPSLFTLYATPPRLADALVVGISQSGQSPDIVSVVEEGRAQGALTLAITNDASSPLARGADLVLDTVAGAERAVAASKTYTAQLTAIAMLCSYRDDEGQRRAELSRLPDLMRAALALEEEVEAAARRFAEMDRCVVLGRGFNYSTAYEWSLKLEETTYVVAEPYSSADFQHGPVALVADGFPVLAVAPRDAVLDDLLALLERLVELEADLFVLTNDDRALELGAVAVRLPDDLPAWLSPMVAVVPAQLFCHHLARLKGYDPDSPRQLRKVTRTW